MRIDVTLLRKCGLVLLLALSAGVPQTLTASPKSSEKAAVPIIRIGNFGQISDQYYRGAQPKAGDYRDLAALGIKTVIDLTQDGWADERQIVERAGMRFRRIPMTTSDRPSPAAITEFLNLVNDPANQPVFVHCQGGRHRTGVMTAVYRITQQGWNADRAYNEMKKYHFEGFPGHPVLKQFVYDYYRNFDSSKIAGNTADQR